MEGGTLMNEINALIKKRSQRAPLPLPPCEDTPRILQTDRDPSNAGTLLWDFQLPGP